MIRLFLFVLACASVAFARGPGPLDGKNVTISVKGRALCSGRPITGKDGGTVKLVLFDTQCDKCSFFAPSFTTLGKAKTDKNGNYRIEGSVAVPTHGPKGGSLRIYLDLTHRCGRYDLPPFAYADAQDDVPTEYWIVQGNGKKVFEHDFLLDIVRGK